MKSKIIALTLAAFFVAMFTTACGNGGAAADGVIRIGISQGIADEFNANLLAMYEAHVATLDGVEVVFTNAEGSSAQQLQDVENLIIQQVDVIVLRPVEGDAAGTAIRAIIDAGIYLVIDEVAVPSDEYHVRIVGTQLDHGRLLGEYLTGLVNAGEIGEINIGYIAGSATAFALGRKNGILETAPSASFVAGGAEGFVLAEFWNAALAQEIVEGWISGGLIHEMNIIAAMNDELANGAIAALAGNFPDIIVLGIDGSAIGQHNIRNGSMRATTFQNLALSARAVVDSAVALSRGETIVFDDAENRLVNPRHLALMTLGNIDELVN